MKNLQWLKTKIGLFDNPKIMYIMHQPNGDSYLIIWFMLRDLAGKINDNGLVYLSKQKAMTAEMLATQFGRRRSCMEKALHLFCELELIDIDEAGFIRMLTWEDDQSSDRERIREQTRLRVAAYRKRQKETAEPEPEPTDEVPEATGTEEETKEKIPLSERETIRYYQQCFGGINPVAAHKLAEMEEDWGVDAVCDGIDRAVKKKTTRVEYIEAVLRGRREDSKMEVTLNEYGWTPNIVRKLNKLFPKKC